MTHQLYSLFARTIRRGGLLLVALVVGFTVTATPVLAASTPTPTRTPTPTKTPRTEQERLVNIKRAGAANIDLRIGKIDKYLTDILHSVTGSCGKTSNTTREQIRGAIGTFRATLVKDKTDLAAATTFRVARAIMDSVYKKQPVYNKILQPAIRLMCLADIALERTIPRIDKAVAALKKLGYNTTPIEADVNSAKTSITAAKTLLVSIANVPGSSRAVSDLKTARKNLRTGHLKLRDAHKKIKAALLVVQTPTPRTTTTP